MENYKLEDISIVIPTYKRADDLKITLKSMPTSAKKIREIIIIDQSPDNNTKNMLKDIKSMNIKYVKSEIPSITIARNLGVEKSSKKSKIICFIDDDVTLGKNFFDGILNVFNTYPEAKAVAGFFPLEKLSFSEKIEHQLKKVFFLRYNEKDRARVISAYGNTYPKKLNKIISSQWIPGVNMSYKKEIFKEQKFDEKLLGYALAEDLDFSYRLYKKYSKSLFITPFAKVVHRYSNKGRYPQEKISYVNQVNHFYFNYKNMNRNFKEKLIFAWAIYGILILRLIKLFVKMDKISFLELKFFIKSLFFCILNLNKIKKGILGH